MDKDQDIPLLHTYSQRHPHDDVVIVSSRSGLLRLKKSIELALENGEGICVAITSDMEKYEIKVILNEENWKAEFWRRLQAPYFDENENEETLSVDDIIGYDIKSSKDLERVQPIMEQYQKYSRKLTDKLRKIAKMNRQIRD